MFFFILLPTKTLISFLSSSVPSCSVTVLPTKKSKSLPPTQQGDFQHHGALKSDSKRETRRLGKDKGVIPSYAFSL